ncbi:TonB-dependent receptor [Aliikangiella coralliicola]|uniref:TonB-dependent receptor n=1 Tax=Aliikangiella coralliicola TaxID=2592383 RepID=A0A545TST1_9GAMM|nr:TonB-dependent receptor [Aliikangiella coralliicola]TQV80283.1 TonB-dependent receptor [Aliikangiella coralliicola]
MKKSVICAAVCAAIWGSGVSAKVIRGEVSNASGEPLANAVLEVRGSQIKVKTDDNGQFQIDLDVGRYTLDVKAGNQAHFHQEIEVVDGQQAPILISLQSEPEHKIVVRANPLEHTSLDMATPTVILAGEELVMKRAGTLGEILQFEPGLSVSSFGPAVSRPVIRGLAGDRVKVTNNQMIVQDASTTSADHDVGIEPLLADQIEVVKGPATLLYGSGAIGGVVNATDRKINADSLEGVSGGVEMRLGDGATGEESVVFTLDGGSNGWNWHIDGYTNSTDDLEIPGLAESEILHESEEAEGEHEEEHEEEAVGVLENSAVETQGGSIGTTFVRSWGHVGLAVSKIDKEYGVPGHAHHEEEHEEGEEEHEEEEHEEHEEEAVLIDMKQTRYDLQAQFNSPMPNIAQLFVGYAYTDYEHMEIEGDEIGTHFDNEAWELKSYIKHDAWNDWSGVLGIQISERDFAAIGEEAFVPPSVTKSRALFIVEEKNYGDLKWELGARFESQSISVMGANDTDESGVSASVGTVYSLGIHNKIAFNFSRAIRFASVEELYSEGPHIATRSFEIGNANLDKEISNNLDFSYRFETEKVSGELNLYYNQFSDFIYAANVADTDPCVSAEASTEAAEEELQLVCYKQTDADFKGIELQLEIPLGNINEHQFALGFVGDYVEAKLDSGGYIPRIPPVKVGAAFRYDFKALSADLNWLHYQDQKNVSDNELPTEGFDIVDLDIAYRLPFAQDELFLFFKGKNLLDEEARDHASFLKDLAPRVGRNFVIGARYTF